MTVYVLEYYEFYSGHTVAVATSLERAQQLLREYVDTKNKFAAERDLPPQWVLVAPNLAHAHPDASVDDEAVEIFVYEADVLHGHKSSA